jgi:hypothetical protein
VWNLELVLRVILHKNKKIPIPKGLRQRFQVNKTWMLAYLFEIVMGYTETRQGKYID